jgi:uncharacterized protein involved in outer membrane biogenesis
MAMSKPVKIIGITLLVFVVLFIGVVGTLYIMFPPSKLKAMALPQVEKLLGRKTDVGSIGLMFYPVVGVKIGDLTIANTNRPGFATAPFIKLEKFIAGVRVLPLFSGKLEISKIVLKRPQILIEIDKKGSYNFDDLALLAKGSDTVAVPQKPSAGPMLPIPITLEQFTIENGTIIYDDKKGGMKVTLGSINQSVAFNIDKELKHAVSKGALTITNLTYASKDYSKPITGITITLSHDVAANVVDGLLTVNDLRLSLQKVFIAVNGTVSNFNATPVLDLKIKTDNINLADLIAEIPASVVPEIAKVKGSGNAQVSMTVKGPLPANGLPEIAGTALLQNLAIHYADLPKTINGLNADIGFTANSLTIAALTLKLGENPVSIKGTIDNFSKPMIDLSVMADINLADLKDIMPLPPDNALSGGITADITAKGEADPAAPKKLDVKGTVALKNLSITTPAVTRPVVMNGTVGLTSQKISPDVRVAIGASTIAFKADFADYLSLVMPDSTKKNPRSHLTFTMASPYLNTDEFLPQSSEPEKSGAAPAEPASGEAALLLGGPLPGIDMQGSITTSRLIYQKIELSNIALTTKSVNDVMDINVEAGMFGGTFSHNLNVDARSYENLKAHSVLAIDNVEVSKTLAAFKHMIPSGVPLAASLKELDKYLSGTIHLKSDLVSNGGTADNLTRNLTGTINAKVQNGVLKKGPLIDRVAGVVEKFYKINDIAFDNLDLKLRVANERVYFVDTMRIQSRVAGDWGVGGDVGFDAALNLDMADKLTKAESAPIVGVQDKAKTALLGQYAGFVSGIGIPSDRDGRVTLLLGLKGPIASATPSFKGFGSGQGSQPAPTVQQQVKQEVAKQVDQAKQKVTNEVEQKATQEIKKVVPQASQKQIDQVKNKLKKLF